MTIISLSTIESSAFNNVFDVLDTRTNIVDPKDAEDKNTRNFVYDSDPFVKSVDHNGTPYIFVDLPTISYSAISAEGKHKDVSWSQKIIVRTARIGVVNSGTDAGRTDMQGICDDLNQTFNSSTIKQSFQDSNMYFITLEKVSTDTIEVEGGEVYEAEYTLTYTTRMAVSS